MSMTRFALNTKVSDELLRRNIVKGDLDVAIRKSELFRRGNKFVTQSEINSRERCTVNSNSHRAQVTTVSLRRADIEHQFATNCALNDSTFFTTKIEIALVSSLVCTKEETDRVLGITIQFFVTNRAAVASYRVILINEVTFLIPLGCIRPFVSKISLVNVTTVLVQRLTPDKSSAC